MNNHINEENKGKKSETIAAIILIVLIIISSVYLIFNDNLLDQLNSNSNNNLTYATNYRNVTATEASNVINQTNDILIIDCRGLEGCGSCTYKKGHLPGSSQNINPSTLFNSTYDILVYSINGTIGARFCEDLLNHVYGKIYNLEGGYDNWLASGLKIETG